MAKALRTRTWRYQRDLERAKRRARGDGPRLIPFLLDERPQPASGGGEGRRLWCRRYDRCLSFVVSMEWDGFDCSACAVDDEPTRDEKLLSAARLVDRATTNADLEALIAKLARRRRRR